ncbi:MAG: response regulator [Candidatus Omnitrophica bacterium]|nr:response regulator [Candidatus Omnitrophota bacterium]
MRSKILVVDDDWAMQEFFKSILELEGFEVLIAGNAGEFRDLVTTEKFDAIILDIMLEDENGPEIYEELVREGLLVSHTPVIFISGLAKDRPPVFPQKERRFALIGKPFDTQRLVRELRKII